MTDASIQFYNDRQIAGLLAVSVSWVRLQRYNRRHGKPHIFDVDPIPLGSAPRYAKADVDEFMARLSAGKENAPHVSEAYLTQ